MVIDLAEDDRNLNYSSLEELVLNEESNRHILRYNIPPMTDHEDNGTSVLGWGIFAGIAILVGSLILKKKYKKRS
jgi:hypothetical protein